MNRLALFPLLLLAAADAPRPEPERRKLPAVPEREKELLRPLQALPELPTSHQLTTAIRDTWQQAREIFAAVGEVPGEALPGGTRQKLPRTLRRGDGHHPPRARACRPACEVMSGCAVKQNSMILFDAPTTRG